MACLRRGCVRKCSRNELNGGDPSLERIAAQIGMSARTLQRRLREQHTSHHEMLDQTRKDLAIRYLNEPRLALAMAYLLGFRAQRFHRAFKR
jgi:AraC-like DNA-binding protein